MGKGNMRRSKSKYIDIDDGEWSFARNFALAYLESLGFTIFPDMKQPIPLASLIKQSKFYGPPWQAKLYVMKWHKEAINGSKSISNNLALAKEPDRFYRSRAWRSLRYEALKEYGAKCSLCGATSSSRVLHVDHIKPRSLFPGMALDIRNLQILCEDCNLGKGNRDDTDWRPGKKKGARLGE